MRDVLEDIEPRHALLGKQLRRVRPGLLQDRGKDVACLDLAALGALNVQHRRLQHTAERGGLLGLTPLAALCLLERVGKIRIEIAPQARQIGAAGGEDPLAVVVVRERVEQMLEGDVRVPARHGLAVGDGEDDFDGGREHDQLTLLRWRRAAGIELDAPAT